MTSSQKILGLVGSGRLATHMEAYFSRLGWKILRWSRKNDGAQDPLGLRNLADAPLVGLAISDSAVDGYLKALKEEAPSFAQKRFFHFSGSLVSSQAFSFHPLMTFGPNLYAEDFYNRIPFVSDISKEEVQALFPDFPNPFYEVPPKDRPYYHALCVLAGNHTVLLWQKFFSEMKNRFGFNEEDLKPYLERTFLNIQEDPASALTGPLVRGDSNTLTRNIESLKGDAFQGVYAAFVKAYQECH